MDNEDKGQRTEDKGCRTLDMGRRVPLQRNSKEISARFLKKWYTVRHEKSAEMF